VSASEDITSCVPIGKSLLVATSVGKVLKVSADDAEVIEEWSGMHSQEVTGMFLDSAYKVVHTVSLDDSIKAISLRPMKRRTGSEQGSMRSVLGVHQGAGVSVSAVSFFHGVLATGNSEQSQVCLWSLETYSLSAQLELEDQARPTAMEVLDRLPVLILAESLGNVLLITFSLRKDNSFLTVVGHLNIVKANILKNLATQSSFLRCDEKQMN
jgi:WD40 repeat protein